MHLNAQHGRRRIYEAATHCIRTSHVPRKPIGFHFNRALFVGATVTPGLTVSAKAVIGAFHAPDVDGGCSPVDASAARAIATVAARLVTLVSHNLQIKLPFHCSFECLNHKL
ncbi:MAG: hypothetical protein V7K32_04120 [Nostoc sp.]|uniref:hypothetical protein n=1 Tax=Nostoc sp. TaxID=1180 RepID=UPI002FF45487